jgi:signal transduction histidine kinase
MVDLLVRGFMDPRISETARVRQSHRATPSRERDGLASDAVLAKRIVEIHGGRIRVESDGDGRGSTFFFTLPYGSP